VADWDIDGPQLRANLEKVLGDVVQWAARRDKFTITVIKRWHRDTMEGLDVPHPTLVGRFRGEPGLESKLVYVGSRSGLKPTLVLGQVEEFVRRLDPALKQLDKILPAGQDLGRDGLQAVVELAAWAHSEWVRIHPFVNGNGRTARILTNAILMRYGLPPVLRLRPRPGFPYEHAGAEGMAGNAKPMEALMRKRLMNVQKGD
jgi:hypothetical protein